MMRVSGGGQRAAAGTALAMLVLLGPAMGARGLARVGPHSDNIGTINVFAYHNTSTGICPRECNCRRTVTRCETPGLHITMQHRDEVFTMTHIYTLICDVRTLANRNLLQVSPDGSVRCEEWGRLELARPRRWIEYMDVVLRGCDARRSALCLQEKGLWDPHNERFYFRSLTVLEATRWPFDDSDSPRLLYSKGLLHLEVHFKDCCKESPPLLKLLSNSTRTLRTLALSGAALPEPLGLPELPRLTTLRLAGCRLRDLANLRLGNRTPKLRVLDFRDNLLERIDPWIFDGLIDLRELNLSNNSILVLPMASLAKDCPLLTTLRASHNQMLALPSLCEQDNAAETRLKMLETLDLSHNWLTVVSSCAGTFGELHTLNLSHNNISEFTDTSCSTTTKLIVDLTNNPVRSIVFSPTAGRGGASSNVTLLVGSQFHCDCWLRPDDVVKARYSGVSCSALPGMSGLPRPQRMRLAERQLDCQIPQPYCVEDCTCWIQPHTRVMRLSCRTLPQSVPQQKVYEFNEIELSMLAVPLSLGNLPPQVKLLNLSGLGMTTFPSGTPPHALRIDLTNNNLTEIPTNWSTRSNSFLKLAGNPLQCDCGTKENLELLQQHSYRVLDYWNVTCAHGEHVQSLTKEKLCAAYYMAQTVVMVLVPALVVVAAGIVLNRYRLEVEILVSQAGLLQRRDESGDGRTYDAFVSYAHEDSDFVLDQLVPRLEEEEGLRLCFHERDWQAGEWIPEAIAASVAQSRRTVLILSRHFLQSRWAHLEFEEALTGPDGDRNQMARILIVMLEDVTDHQDIDSNLRAYLRTNTYVKWGDRWFWRKLLHALPRPSLSQESARRSTAHSTAPPRSVSTAVLPMTLMSRMTETGNHPADVITA